jgi:hypothetical protein
VSDPQSLDFAPHVNNHALVAVLQRGLLYHEAERLSAQVCRSPQLMLMMEWQVGQQFDS